MDWVIATWNVNSLRVRLPQVLDFLKKYQPDILALQETKLENAFFPEDQLRSEGYHTLFNGQKAYNGVAFLSKIPLKPIEIVLPRVTNSDFSDHEARFLSAEFQNITIINIYVPNGYQVHSEKYYYKLAWLEHLYQYLKHTLEKTSRVILLGDYNIAPTDQDVYDPITWKEKLLCSSLERSFFQKFLYLGLHDVFRLKHSEIGHYTWWDYRNINALKRNLGLRIDCILCSQDLANHCHTCVIAKEMRATNRPSDHAPVLSYFSKVE